MLKNKVHAELATRWIGHVDTRHIPLLCPACTLSFKMQELRQHSFWINEKELRFLNKQEVAKCLFNPPEPPFAFCVTVSHKKHMLYLSTLNLSRKRFYVQFEETRVLFDANEMEPVWNTLVELYEARVPKNALATGDYAAKNRNERTHQDGHHRQGLQGKP